MPRKRQRIAVQHRMAGDRRAARAVEHGEERALAGERHAGVGMIDLRQQLARARIVDARLDRDRALPDRRQKLARRRAARSPCRRARAASARRAPARSRRPRRRRACAAASRHCRAARTSTDPAAAASPCACRRSDAVPTTAPCGRSRKLAALRLMKASRTSSRGRHAASISPSGSTVGMSFAECTARSIVPASSASSISLVNSPLPPASAQRPVLDAVARGADRHDLDRVLGASHARRRAPRAPGAPARARADCRACRCEQIASRDLPMLRGATAYSASLDKQMLVLGIETTCDETAAAVVRRDEDGRGEILSNIVLSQTDEHAPYGGVVPEIAARAHVEVLDIIIAQAMIEANASFAMLDGVAAAAGPGLIGGVIVGLTTAKAIALVAEKPLIAVNHLEAHALTARLTDGTAFPYCLFLASGGHTQIVAVLGVGKYVRLGTTHRRRDRRSLRQDRQAARARLSGRAGGRARGAERRCAALHPAAPDARPRRGGFLALGTEDRAARRGREGRAAERSGRRRPVRRVPAGGGRRRDATACAPACGCSASSSAGRPRWWSRAASRSTSRSAARSIASRIEHGTVLVAPPPELCTDNGAMIAWAGCERLALGLTDTLDVAPRARWPLDGASGRAQA